MVNWEVGSWSAALALGALVAGCEASGDANAASKATTSGGDGGHAGHGATGSGGEAGVAGATGGLGGAGASTGDRGASPPPAVACTAVVATALTTLAEPIVSADDAAAVIGANFLWSGDGIIGVWGGMTGRRRVIQLDAAGALRGPVQDLWPGRAPSDVSEVAVAGHVLAVVEQVFVGGRPECVLGLASLPDVVSIQEPTRFSDPTEAETILNEAQYCSVTGTGDGFLVAWQQYTSRTSGAWSLFAQRYGLNGAPQGERMTLTSGGDFDRVDVPSLTVEGTRVTVAFSEIRGTTSTFAFIEGNRLTTATAPVSGPLRTRAAHGALIAQTNEQAWLLDANGSVRAGPVALPDTSLGPLGEGYVSVAKEEYLVARTVDGNLAPASEPTGLSLDRSASWGQLVFAPDGTWTAVLHGDDGQRRLSRLTCSDQPPPPPGPPPCPEAGDVEPLDHGCTDPVCHLAIRLDYRTLGLRGYTSAGGPQSPVDAAEASEVARVAFDSNGTYLSPDIEVGPASAGVFVASVSPSDFGAFALVGSSSGALIAAGGVVWGGRGRYWVPPEWQPAGGIACGDVAAAPAEVSLGPADCGGDEAAAATPQAALDVALRTNLAQHYASRGPFSAFVYLYTPTVGRCDPSVAEYVVVLTAG
jgi:hypothetical protein